MARQLVCLGYGYVAAALARRLGSGWKIVGTSRSGAAADGVDIAPFDGTHTERVAFAIARADAILCSIPPREDGDVAVGAFGPELRASSAWIGYLSTTGVYGDRRGGWAFERDAASPQSVQAQRRAVAEAQWRGAARQTNIFRLPGIYGPGRSALDRVRAGEARRVVRPGLVHSRVHVEDVASALAAAIEAGSVGATYNVCDDVPSPPETVIEEAARLAGIAPPPLVPFEHADLTPAARRFYEESRRVSNARLKAELGWRPQYPSYREGLAAIAQSE